MAQISLAQSFVLDLLAARGENADREIIFESARLMRRRVTDNTLKTLHERGFVRENEGGRLNITDAGKKQIYQALREIDIMLPVEKITANITGISLFSGIAGLDLAFSLAGVDILAQVEINEFCQKVLRKHAQTYWKNAALYSDVRSCGYGRAHPMPYADIIWGGFPCQDTSDAGKQAGIRKGAKSRLWYEFRRLIGEIRPRVVFLENVEGILHKGRGGVDVIADLAALGYVGQSGIISAADAGAPHLRKRWFCVGYANGFGHQESRTAEDLYHYEEWDNTPREQGGRNEFRPPVANGEMGYANGARWQNIAGCKKSTGQRVSSSTDENRTRRMLAQSRLGRNVDGISDRLDGHRLMQHQYPAPTGAQFEDEPPRTTDRRSEERLEALGNGCVPQCVYPAAALIVQQLRNERRLK